MSGNTAVNNSDKSNGSLQANSVGYESSIQLEDNGWNLVKPNKQYGLPVSALGGDDKGTDPVSKKLTNEFQKSTRIMMARSSSEDDLVTTASNHLMWTVYPKDVVNTYEGDMQRYQGYPAQGDNPARTPSLYNYYHCSHIEFSYTALNEYVNTLNAKRKLTVTTVEDHVIVYGEYADGKDAYASIPAEAMMTDTDLFGEDPFSDM